MLDSGWLPLSRNRWFGHKGDFSCRQIPYWGVIISPYRKQPKEKTSPSTKISWKTLWLEILALAGRRGGRTRLVRPFFLPIQPTFRFDEHPVQVSRRYRELRSPSYKVKIKTIFNWYWVTQFEFLSKFIQTQERNHPQGGHWLWKSG